MSSLLPELLVIAAFLISAVLLKISIDLINLKSVLVDLIKFQAAYHQEKDTKKQRVKKWSFH